MQDEISSRKMLHLIQTANGRYAFNDVNLNDLVDFTPLGFRSWLQRNWTRS
jgi:hypothetical protein